MRARVAAQGQQQGPRAAHRADLREIDRGRTRRAGVDLDCAIGAPERDCGRKRRLLRGAILLGGETAGVDVVERQVTVRALESDEIHAADLAYREIVGVRLGRRARLLIERGIDVDGRAVRIEDRTERLENLDRAGVVGKRRARLDLEHPFRIRDAQREREGSAGDVRIDRDALQVVDAGVDARAVAQGRGDHGDRRIRARHQAGGRRSLGPADLFLVDAGLLAHEGDRVVDLAA